jgi:M-phase inducer tyrosine phosphatase
MFEHPCDVLQQQKNEQQAENALQSIMDVEEPQLGLPHFFPGQDSIPRITRETMINVLDGNFKNLYDDTMVIDCRFEYEYRGGHIDGAINFNDREQLAKMLFEKAKNGSGKTLLIFHCEYSAHRAPIAARFIRHEDRANNVHQYPKLDFPEVYILEGGYSSFFKEHKARCFPQNYVEMDDKQHENACEQGLGRMKQQRKKLGRAQTFAFGQHGSPSLMDSPTAQNQSCSDLVMGMDLSFDSPDGVRRGFAKRLASY